MWQPLTVSREAVSHSCSPASTTAGPTCQPRCFARATTLPSQARIIAAHNYLMLMMIMWFIRPRGGFASGDSLHASKDGELLERMGKLMAYMKLGNLKAIKKMRRKAEREALEAAAGGGGGSGGAAGALRKPVDEDDDIFEDAGKQYICEPKKAASVVAAAEAKAASYFGDTLTKGEAAMTPTLSSRALEAPDAEPWPQHAPLSSTQPPPPPPGPAMPPIPLHGPPPGASPFLPGGSLRPGWVRDSRGVPQWDAAAFAAYTAFQEVALDQGGGREQRAQQPQPQPGAGAAPAAQGAAAVVAPYARRGDVMSRMRQEARPTQLEDLRAEQAACTPVSTLQPPGTCSRAIVCAHCTRS